MKGQVFLIGAIIIVIAIVLLKNLYGIYETMEEKMRIESLTLDSKLKNIVNEYNYAAGIASVQESVDPLHLSSFSSFLRNETGIEALYVFAYANGTSYSVTTGNFLGNKINITLNASDSSPAQSLVGVINDKTNSTKGFVSSINGTVTISVNYKIGSEEISERVALPIANNSLAAFIDVRLSASEMTIRSKSLFNRTW